MAKKASINISRIAVIRGIVFLLLGFIFLTAYVDCRAFLTHAPLFEIKDVMIERSIQFIDRAALKDLKGRNIFKVDIQKIHRQIAQRYPYIAGLCVIRQLPDRILILAQKREPLMQIYFKKKYLLLDTEGVALYYVLQPMPLPEITGIALEGDGLFLGGLIKDPQLRKVVDILNMFKAAVFLKHWRIHAVAVSNLSKIDLLIGENRHVLLDQDTTQDKIDTLQMLVSSHKINLARVKYIDLRYKEPLIADNVKE